MVSSGPVEVGGYVLAGGKSSRMGRNKALLALGGEPLVCHAVKKLRRVCRDVRILTGDSELSAYAPLVPDLHPGCGPMGGMEAGLLHSTFEWNLFLAVDMPFVPSTLISDWLRVWLEEDERREGARVRMFTVDGRPQPGFCLLHKEVAPFLSAALEQGQYKLLPVLEAAGRELALKPGLPPGAGCWNVLTPGLRSIAGERRSEESRDTTEAQQAAQHLWFANLNTPEDFAEAEKHLNALDT